MIDRNSLLNESYSQFTRSLSNSGKLRINQRIQSKVRYLNECYGLEPDEILSDLWEAYQSRRHYEKHDSGKSKLSTFIVNYTNLSLKNLMRKHDTFRQNHKEIPLSRLEKLGVRDVVENNTPEDYYIARELLDLVTDFFDKDDVPVLLGFRDRLGESERLSIDYYTYCKRLNRDISAFKSHIKNVGYL